MQCYVNCSFGEVIDKLSILNIKLEKCPTADKEKRNNILTEKNKLMKYYDENDKTLVILYNKLLSINKQLWEYEDDIRYKSEKKEFDSVYINIAEAIHKTNDQRYLVKKEINVKYNSEIKEEKLHKNIVLQENTQKKPTPNPNLNPNPNPEYIEIIEELENEPQPNLIKPVERVESPPTSPFIAPFEEPFESPLNQAINVINLDFRQEKLSKFISQFGDQYIKINRFNAIKGESTHDPNTDLVSSKNYKTPLKMGEKGCYFSHKTLWEKCIKERLKYIIIAEDDLIRESNFSYKNIQNSIDELIIKNKETNWDILYLSKTIDKTHDKTNMGFKYGMADLNKQYTLSKKQKLESIKLDNIKPIEPRCGLHFYVMSRQGCKKALQAVKLYGFQAPIDVILWYSPIPLNSYILKHGLVGESPDICDTYTDGLIQDMFNYIGNLNGQGRFLVSPKTGNKLRTYSVRSNISNDPNNTNKNSVLKSDRRKIKKLSKRQPQTYSLIDVQFLRDMSLQHPNWHIPPFLIAKYFESLIKPNTLHNEINYNLKIILENYEHSINETSTDYSVHLNYAKFLSRYGTHKSCFLQWINCLKINQDCIFSYVNIIHLLIIDNFIIKDTTFLKGKKIPFEKQTKQQQNYSRLDSFLLNITNRITDNVSLYGSVASYFEYRGNDEMVMSLYQKALTIEPNNPDLLFNTGLMAAKSLNLSHNCEAYFKRSINEYEKQGKQKPNVYISLAKYYSKTKVNRFQEALKVIQKGKNIFKTIDFLFEESIIYSKLPNFQLAIKGFKKVISVLKQKNGDLTKKGMKVHPEHLRMLGESYKELAVLYKWTESFQQSHETFNYLIDNLSKFYKTYDETSSPKQCYGQLLLLNGEYTKGYPYYMWGHHYYNLHNLTKNKQKLMPRNSCFFEDPSETTDIANTTDTANKEAILLYNSGGFGDAIMYNRFINDVAIKFPNNKIVCLLDRKLYWLFQHADFAKRSNVELYSEDELELLKQAYSSENSFKYHTDVMMLAYYLKLDYKDIYLNDYLSTGINKAYKNDYFYRTKVKPILRSPKKYFNIVINWHGNRDNGMDRWQRGISLENLKPLFSIYNINWICVQKEQTREEHKFLSDNNILDFSEEIDNNGKAFENTISIFKNVDLVISTDTSLLHLAATLKVRTWALITKVPEFRWGLNSNKTNWYPDVPLYRQQDFLDWSHPVGKMAEDLYKFTNNVKNKK